MRTIAETIAARASELLAIPGVVIVYEGRDDRDRPCVVIGVRQRTEELDRQLPRTLDGHPVRVEEHGEIAPR